MRVRHPLHSGRLLLRLFGMGYTLAGVTQEESHTTKESCFKVSALSFCGARLNSAN